MLSLSHNFAANQSNADFFTFPSVISDKQSFISENLEVVGPLGEKFKFFIPLGIQIEKDLSHINTRIKLQSFRALKRYLNEENLTHDRKTATIKKFAEQY